MVNFAVIPIVLAAQLALGAPGAKRDSAVGDEVAVSAPDGTPITDTAELASQTAAEASSKAANGYLTTMAYESSSTEDVMSSSDNAYDSVAYETTSSEAYEYTSSAEAYDTTSSEAYEYTSTAESYDTSSSEVYEYTSTAAAYDTTSSAIYDTTSTAYTSVATYGSGSSNWGNSGYNDCVQQCIASFGAPMATYTPSYTSGSDSGSSGTGATHTIIVAPSQGVLRYVPFATNASVGDTIKFMWNANMHTVTKSSELELCNKTSDAPFTSGVQNKSFVFTQVVNTTDPTFFYCGVPTHCQKGMFGIINPPNADVSTSNSSVSAMMPGLVSNSSEVSAWNTYTEKMTQGSTKAAAWGGSIDMATMPEWASNVVAENVMYTRSFLAANPDVMKDDGSIDLGASSAPLMIPQDLNAVMAASSGSSSADSAAPTASGSSAAGASASASPSATNGARSLGVSTALAGVVALGAAFLAL